MYFKHNLKKQIKLNLGMFLFLNSNFVFFKLNDYIKNNLQTNTTFNASFTTLLFAKNEFLSTQNLFSYYNLSLKSFISFTILIKYITKQQACFKDFLKSIFFKLKNNFYCYTVKFSTFFKSNVFIFNWVSFFSFNFILL